MAKADEMVVQAGGVFSFSTFLEINFSTSDTSGISFGMYLSEYGAF